VIIKGIREEPESYGGGDTNALMAAVIVYKSYIHAEKTTCKKLGNKPLDISSSTIFAKPYESRIKFYDTNIH
jgi:hypothetical protein